MRIVTRRVATIKYPANALFALFTTLGGGVECAAGKRFSFFNILHPDFPQVVEGAVCEEVLC